MSTEAFDIKVTEIEHKYNSDDVKLSTFVDFANRMSPEKHVEVSSWDYYYSGPKLPFEFIRFRGGEDPELTIKIKTEEKNNQNRIEVDLPLKNKVPEWLVAKFVSLFGFKENFRVFKHCYIYWYKNVDIVFYIVYDKDMKERGRRIEIEARKDCTFKTEEEAIEAVKTMESAMAEIGISPQKRMKLSNWEQFRKDV